MTPDEFRAALSRLGWTQAEAGRQLKVDDRTIRRWLAEERKIPGTVEVALALLERAKKDRKLENGR